MTEMTILKCDGVGCEAWIQAYPTPGSKEAEELSKWTKDDMDADICPKCHARDLGLEQASEGVNLEGFGKILSEEADKLHEAAAAEGLTQSTDFSKPEGDLSPPSKPKVSKKDFDKAVAGEVKKLTKLLKQQGHQKSEIDEAVDQFKAAAAENYEVT